MINDIDIDIDIESKRVAAAFKVTQWKKSKAHYERLVVYEGTIGEIEIEWSISESGLFDVAIAHPNYERTVSYFLNLPNCKPDPNGTTDDFMAKGLFLLGFDDEILNELPELTAHEKIELRLSFPREFWPKKWLDELAQSPSGT
jgi:hypothetical protein